jgi:tagatose-6-phosphate ketose/aldose isomerase
VNPLTALLELPRAEKKRLGIVHTPQEIAQQPDTWAGTARIFAERQQEVQSFLESAGVRNEAGDRPVVFLIGAGTSDYIGRSLHHLLRERWQCEVIPVPSTDLLIDFSDYILPDRPYLWISFSRSGDSPEGVAVLERGLAEHPQIHNLVVSCNADGKMIRMIEGKPNCLGIVLGAETNDQGLAMTSSFTNMVIAGQALAHAWCAKEYHPILDQMCEAGRAFIPIAAESAADLATKDYRRACFIGSGLLAGTAQEAALKLLELTAGKIKTMSQSTLALRHGPMAVLDHETLLVSFLSTQSIRRHYEIDLLREIEGKQLAGASLAVVGCGSPALAQPKSTPMVAPARQFTIPDLYRPAVDILFGQLLGLFSSLRCGLAPDAPSPNGAISRVVQPIEIYQ